MASSNPAFSQDVFAGYDQVYGAPRSMTTTVQGTMSKTFLLLAILSGTALWTWNAVGSGQMPIGVVVGAALAGFVTSLVTIFKPSFAPWTAPVYAAMEGVFLGGISQLIEAGLRAKYGNAYQGVALQAVSLTVGTTLVMLFLYASGMVKVTEKLRSGIMMATGAVCLFYLVSMLLRMFGVTMPMIWSATPIGIGFSLFVVGLAAFNLLLDFDFIEEAARREAPKYMEWYGAFGLMVTLVWLYLEILRLLAKLANSRD
ncbi:Bax inhibitor-1/YccA family protein [Paludisphaera mucosa]|uniref:Bax inhibitor-1/YccA family protein n=1 Tax=Paludisphaera mucosa TaxID=3030827 RepID=A0ABT6FH26_9BACT|nr:Bax inhibitor-1/YccA family protein [Paludisphaera mucosa]